MKLNLVFSSPPSAEIMAEAEPLCTALLINEAQTAFFPELLRNQYYDCIITRQDGQTEVVKVTCRTAGALTVMRGQEGTKPLKLEAGDKIAPRQVNSQTVVCESAMMKWETGQVIRPVIGPAP